MGKRGKTRKRHKSKKQNKVQNKNVTKVLQETNGKKVNLTKILLAFKQWRGIR